MKLDRALVDRIDQDEIKRSVAELLGGLAGRMDSWLLAEGIERGEELEAAIAMGVPLGQGWLFGRPGPAWQPLHPDMATRIRLLAYQQARHDSVASLVQPVPPVRRGDDDGGSGSPAAPGLDVARHRRRRRLPAVAREPRPRRRTSAGVDPDQHPTADVESGALRAIAREPAQRFDPLVAVDDTGRYLGVVVMERLIGRLAQLRTTT